MGSEQRFDVVIAESKAGEDAKPNRVWRNSEVAPVAYIVRFVGLHLTDDEIGKIASALSTQYRYEDQECRFRYIVFSREPNEHYASRGVTYIDLRSVVNLLVDVRGQCWIDANIGVASIHHQWNPLIKQIFAVANDLKISVEARRDLAYRKFLELAGKDA